MPTAVITMDSMVSAQPDFIKFKDKSQKTWNCNKEDLIPHFTPGERYFIDYNETEPKNGYKYGSKYINRARFWKEEDGANTWPDKEPYNGGSGYSKSNGGSMAKNDYDPEVGKRQTAANVAGNIIANARQGAGFTVDDLEEFSIIFKTAADLVYQWVNEGAKSGDTAGTSDAGSASDDDFGF